MMFLQEAGTMQAQRIIELLLNGSLVLYIYMAVKTRKLSFTSHALRQTMSLGRWAKYIGATLFIKVIGIIVLTIGSLLLLLVFPVLFDFVEALFTQETLELSTPTALQFMLMVISICILTPIWEEFFFRGIVFRRFALRTKTTRAAIYSSIIFGILHFGGSSVVHAFLVGILFCYIYASTQNIWVTVLLHGIGNFLSILPQLLPAAPYTGFYLPSQEQIKEELMMMLFPLLLCLVAGAILLKKYWPRLQRMSVIQKEENHDEQTASVQMYL